MGTSKGMGKTVGGLFLSAALLVLALQVGCANHQSVNDFSMGTSEFASSYDTLYSGSYDTCLSTAEIRNIILELGETPSRSPLAQLSDDKAQCSGLNSATEAFNQTSLGLSDFSKALNVVATRNQLGSFNEVQFIPQFTGIDESAAETVPELGGHTEEIAKVNMWKDYFQSFYVQKTPQEMILETQPQVTATLGLLSVFSDIYQVQLDNYERNIKVLDTLLYDVQSDDPVKRTFVINRSRDQNRRQELLKNYNESLQAVKDSYKKIYERSELTNPHYKDPIFQQEMKEFLIKISNLVQQSKLIS
jgi:hypothetical protein